MECEYLKKCPFFNDMMAQDFAASDMFKRIFCHGDNSSCARYMVAMKLGRDKIPPDLYPNDREMAIKIITGQITV